MQTLLEQQEREPHAAQAIELFCYQLRKHIRALTAVRGGLDPWSSQEASASTPPGALGGLPGLGVPGD